MKEVDPIFNIVFNKHPLGVSFNQLRCRSPQLIGQQKSRFFVTKIANNDLSYWMVIVV